MLPKCILSIKGRSCNQTPLVHQDITKKTTVYEKLYGEITQVKCKIGSWFLSSALPLINIYVCTKFHINPVCTLQDIWPGQTSIMEKRGDFVNTQGMSVVLVHGTFSHCHISINQVLFQSLKYFPRYCSDRHPI